MVKTVGIDPGDHAVKVVELDGNYRKTRLLRVHSEAVASVPTDGRSRAEAVAAAVRAALDQGMRGEAILGHPCREAVLRVIELPFKGHEAIRKVVKAEIEGEIHSHVVDDMVVDFHEIGAGAEGGTRVLVAAVPKDGLRTQLAALSALSIEAEHVDLDTMALWRAAHWAGAFEVPEGATIAAGEPLPMTAVVDLGARSVKVLLVEGENLVEMRALRIGDGSVADEIARRHGLDAATSREAVRSCLATGADHHVGVVDAVPAPAADAVEAAAPVPAAATRQVTVTHEEVEAAQTSFLQRLARELVRYLTSSGKASRIRALWITGGACRIAGMKEMLGEVFGNEARELDVLGRLHHELDPEVAAELGPQLATAIGLALARLGGPTGFQLRQEDLVLTRGFERVKFPLAITCMVGLLALFVYGNKRSMELRNLELQIGKTYVNPKEPKAPPQFHGMVNSVFAGKWFENQQQFRLENQKGKDYTYKDLVAELLAEPVHRRVLIVRDKLKAVADQKQKESGIYEDVSLESGLAVLVRFAQILKPIEPQLGRYLVLKIDLNMKAPNRRLEFLVAFRDDFRDRLTVLQQAVEAEYAKADTPFERPKERDDAFKEEVFRDSAESGVRGAYFKVVLRVKDTFVPFGPSTPPSLGALDVRKPADAGGPQPGLAVAGSEGRR